MGTYAGRLLSQPGTHNGLYWPTEPGQRPSPLGPYAAQVTAEGYDLGAGQGLRPYHGDLFRILDAQGEAAEGGAKSYLQDGRLAETAEQIALIKSYNPDSSWNPVQ